MTRKQKISRNQRNRWNATRVKVERYDDRLAMLAANVDYVDWAKMSEFHRQLFRIRAQQAMSIFMEQSDVQS